MPTKAEARKLIALVPFRDESGKRGYAVRLSIGCQSFKIDTAGTRNRREASWFADQLSTALANLK